MFFFFFFFFSVVVFQSSSISQNADSLNATDEHNPGSNTVVDRSGNNVVNPACKDNLTELSERNTTAEASLVASLTDAVTAITFDQGNLDGADVNETYSLNSESEIFITERQLDILEDNDWPVGRVRGGRSESSESSLSTDNESLERFGSTDENNLDESIM